ncbi:hypothetical protein N431DRAFT_435754 [Stipitochalara longipes BDJ]|nr:hypothetical protein N431DRAFT_435754 [Stipitochalara longipes BDJ]
MLVLFPILLLAEVFQAAAEPTPVNATIEVDLVFPLNQTYAPSHPFPVIFVIQNAALAWNFGFQFLWNISGVPDDEGAGHEIFGPGFLFVGPNSPKAAPSDPFIVINSTNFPGLINGPNPLPVGQWTLGWSYEILSACTPTGNLLHIQGATPIQGSIGFTVKDGGASPDFTGGCPMLAGQVGIVANWTGCPQLGTPGPSNPCAAKIDTAQASSISMVIGESAPTASATGTSGTSAGSGSNTLTTGGSSPTAGSSSKSPNVGGKEQSRSWLLAGVALLAGFGALLL